MAGAGKRDRTLTVYREIETARNALNEPVMARGVFFETKAQRRDLSAGEALAAGVDDAFRRARFVILLRGKASQLTAGDEFECDGQSWEITGLMELAQPRRRYLEIRAVTRDA